MSFQEINILINILRKQQRATTHHLPAKLSQVCLYKNPKNTHALLKTENLMGCWPTASPRPA